VALGTYVSFSVTGNRHSIITDLEDEELCAIGRITVQWSYLEHMIFSHSEEMAEFLKIPPPEDMFSLSFKKRLRAWRLLVKAIPDGAQDKAAYLKVGIKIGNLERSRHRITHGMWDWEPKNPQKLKASSYRRPHQFNEPFDAHKLRDLADQIGVATFQFRYPTGKDEAIKDLGRYQQQQRGAIVSRGFLLILDRKASERRRRSRSKPE
jgi:hypothetical protein